MGKRELFEGWYKIMRGIEKQGMSGGGVMNEKQALILEGLARADFLQKNKVFLQSIMRRMEKRIRGRSYLGTVEIESDGINLTLMGFLDLTSSFGLELYQAGDFTIIGLPCKHIRLEVAVDKDKTFANSHFLRGYKKRHPGEDLPMGTNQLVDLLMDKSVFLAVYDGYLNGVERVIDSSLKVTCKLKDTAYPMFGRRDCLPLLIFNFKSGDAYMTRSRMGDRAISFFGDGNVVKFSEGDFRADPKYYLDYIFATDNIPYGLLQTEFAFEVDGESISGKIQKYKGW